MSRSLARYALILGLTSAAVILGSQVPSVAAEGESATAGRYQLATHLDGRILIIDTTPLANAGASTRATGAGMTKATSCARLSLPPTIPPLALPTA